MLNNEINEREELIELLKNNSNLTLVDNAVNQATIHYLQNCTSFEEFEMSLEDLDIMEDIRGTEYYDRVVETTMNQIDYLADQYNITVEDRDNKSSFAKKIAYGAGAAALGLGGVLLGKKLRGATKAISKEVTKSGTKESISKTTQTVSNTASKTAQKKAQKAVSKAEHEKIVAANKAKRLEMEAKKRAEAIKRNAAKKEKAARNKAKRAAAKAKRQELYKPKPVTKSTGSTTLSPAKAIISSPSTPEPVKSAVKKLNKKTSSKPKLTPKERNALFKYVGNARNNHLARNTVK